jgi:transforming growth factor-beta-induced protein
MTRTYPFARLLAASSLVLVLAACGGGSEPPQAPTAPSATALSAGDAARPTALSSARATAAPAVSAPSIVEIAQSSSDFSILVEAVVTAGLAETLSGPGPFTVFAPTNAAFAALLAEWHVTKEQVLADKELLTAILTYHVLPGRVPASALSNGLGAGSVNGQPLRFFASDAASGFSIADGRFRHAGIVATDIAASNGVIHVIDRVLLPSNSTVVGIATKLPDFSILVQAVVAAGLVDTLSGHGPFTVFAPTNEAFAALLAELGVTAEQLLANRELLTTVLTYHVVPGRVISSGIPFGQPVATVQGQTITIGASPVAITDARGRTAGIVATDIPASNGVIHVIDRVILPR